MALLHTQTAGGGDYFSLEQTIVVGELLLRSFAFQTAAICMFVTTTTDKSAAQKAILISLRANTASTTSWPRIEDGVAVALAVTPHRGEGGCIAGGTRASQGEGQGKGRRTP